MQREDINQLIYSLLVSLEDTSQILSRIVQNIVSSSVVAGRVKRQE